MSIHHEFRSTDPKATARFLEDFFGWITSTWKNDVSEYLVFSDKKEDAAIFGDIDEFPSLPPDPTSVVYFEVTGLKTTLEKAQSAGAKIYRPYKDVGGDVKIAIITAPGGTHLGLWSKD